MYNPHVNHDHFLYNVIFSRFINWPETLAHIGYIPIHSPDSLDYALSALAKKGKVWGGAYIITTHGIPMGKAPYLAHRVLGGVEAALDGLIAAGATGHCATLFKALKRLEGLGDFLAAQVIADVKNTPGHPLNTATDRYSFVAPGPGSMRGASWFFYGEKDGITEASFPDAFSKIRKFVDMHLPDGEVIDNQDLQNCLCEFDKFMRVSGSTGRSKRGYNGTI
jgi:hypothetical protein